MIEKELMIAYRESRIDFENAKNVLQKSCDSMRLTKLPLMQALLDECYPDLHLKIEDTSSSEFSMDCVICIPIENSMSKKKEMALHEKIYEKIMESLAYIENMEENEL